MKCSLALAVVIALAAPAGAAAQAPPPGGSGAQVVRAAGMALQDGTLAPGSLTVRIVQGNFSGNLAGIDVELDVSGEGAKRMPTGADGRAAFAHLPIGSTVVASAVVNGERLQSERFTMPAEAGIRLLFVAGGEFVDTATREGAQAIPPIAAGSAPPLPDGAGQPTAASPGASAGPERPGATPAGGPDRGVATLRVVMIVLTLAAFALVVRQQWRRRRPGTDRERA